MRNDHARFVGGEVGDLISTRCDKRFTCRIENKVVFRWRDYVTSARRQIREIIVAVRVSGGCHRLRSAQNDFNTGNSDVLLVYNATRDRELWRGLLREII